MRLFYLENEIGERKPLNNEENLFLYNPSGLGIEFDNDYNKSGTGFFTRIKNGVAQTAAEFTLYFMPGRDNPYKLYRDLIDWIAKSKELYFVYCPQNSVSSLAGAISFFNNFDSQTADKYYKRIEVSTIDKSEINKEGILICSVSLLPLTPWFLPQFKQVAIEKESDSAMRYTFTWSDDLVYAIGATNYSARVETTGHIPAAIKLTWKGAVSNPTIYLRGYLSRKILGECSILGTFIRSDTIILSTAEQDSYICKIDAAGNKTDLLDNIDITSNPFFRLPIDEPAEIIVDGDNIIGSGNLVVYDYYRGV